MFGSDVAMPQLQRFTQRELQHLLGMRSEGNVACRSRGALADHLLDLLAGVFQRHAFGFESLGGHAISLTNQPKQQMLGADVIVLEGTSLFLREHDDPARTVGKPFEHACPSIINTIPNHSTEFAERLFPFSREIAGWAYTARAAYAVNGMYSLNRFDHCIIPIALFRITLHAEQDPMLIAHAPCVEHDTSCHLHYA